MDHDQLTLVQFCYDCGVEIKYFRNIQHPVLYFHNIHFHNIHFHNIQHPVYFLNIYFHNIHFHNIQHPV
ncbi:hypothetical protein SDRG_05662 [Saprolegnia diclina VS20]|uniref:Uncharacterized protein n=1 Tax=Saprolegnia diclina (strain VS20) TaxID=1156394 RepID=T0QQ02_SAPDV|nr:hypothetical protein SDRG_05662 [Saprolegnia diclina VS20]EQC36831.1 hypothetical protein SDRG_05662 [Saprolegnia diclina VS20]|eukprot:XP_008609612.1 hypothetical protein SDRG_05662 [Saprolegnia diclina VS20]